MKFSTSNLLLYAVTDRSWLNGRSLAEVVRMSLDGGATMIQLREKNLGYEAFKYQALEVKELCREYNVPFIVNDNVNIAIDVDADGVHVGQSDMEAGNVRALIGTGKILGVSAQTVDEAKNAEERGADYIGAGAVFHTGSKSDAVDITHDTLKAICEAVKIPVVAIGGINSANILQLKGSGIAGVAVISAIYAAQDITASAKELRRLAGEL